MKAGAYYYQPQTQLNDKEVTCDDMKGAMTLNVGDDIITTWHSVLRSHALRRRARRGRTGPGGAMWDVCVWGATRVGILARLNQHRNAVPPTARLNPGCTANTRVRHLATVYREISCVCVC